MSAQSSSVVASRSKKNIFAQIMKAEWLGQTIASLCWICSMFIYGIESSGDWLQLIAASAWLFANVASLNTAE